MLKSAMQELHSIAYLVKDDGNKLLLNKIYILHRF